jgi:hypothetical protein
LRKRYLAMSFLVIVKLLLAAPDGVELVAALMLAVNELRQPLKNALVFDLPPFGLLHHAVDPDQQAAYPLQLGFGALLLTEISCDKRNHSADGFADHSGDYCLRRGFSAERILEGPHHFSEEPSIPDR